MKTITKYFNKINWLRTIQEFVAVNDTFGESAT